MEYIRIIIGHWDSDHLLSGYMVSVSHLSKNCRGMSRISEGGAARRGVEASSSVMHLHTPLESCSLYVCFK